MFNVTDYGKPISIITGNDILDVCQNQEVLCSLIPEGWEMLLPRVLLQRWDTIPFVDAEKEHLWFAEIWWRSVTDGTLGYYTQINLETGMLKEFRELSGEISVSYDRDASAEERYLEQCAQVINRDSVSPEETEELDILWQSVVPEELRKLVMVPAKERPFDAYLLPLESLTYWNWEKMKTLLLKRYDTTEEEIMDYIEYQRSGSDEFYVEPKLRDLAREKGMRFWRDGYDG